MDNPKPKLRVLVIDDDPDMLSMVSRLLNRKGFQVRAFPHPGEIVDALKDHPVAALIDVNLGKGINGISLARDLRNLRPAMKILIMSGQPLNAEKVEQVGFGPMLQKPFPLENLIRRLGRTNMK